VNASYQEGWLEWKTNARGKRACRLRYWIRDESKPTGWRKAAQPWQTGLTKKQANRKLRDWMQQLDQMEPSIPAPEKLNRSLTLSEFRTGMWQMYRRNRGIKRSTHDGHESMLKKHVIPELGNKVLDEISPADLTLFFDTLAQKGLSTKTQVNVYQLLHAMFEVALEHDLIKSTQFARNYTAPNTSIRNSPFGHLNKSLVSSKKFQPNGRRSSGVWL